MTNKEKIKNILSLPQLEKKKFIIMVTVYSNQYCTGNQYIEKNIPMSILKGLYLKQNK